jgi:hypothetical protein
MDDKITAARELMAAYLDREQSVEGYTKAVWLIYPKLPIVREEKAEACPECNGTGKAIHTPNSGVAS